MTFALVAARVVPMVLWLWPRMLGASWLRLVGAGLVSAWVAAAMGQGHAQDVSAGLWLRELAIGAVLGLGAAVPVRAAELGARMLGAGTDAMTRGLVALSWATFAAAGGVYVWLSAVAQSYQVAPVGARVTVEDALTQMLKLWALALELALPIVVLIAAVEGVRALLVRVQPVLREVIEPRAVAVWATAAAVSWAAGTWVLRVASAVR